jgi:hypothetical protein
LLVVHGRQDGLHSFPDVEAAMARVSTIYAAAGRKGQNLNGADRFRYQWGESGHKFYPGIMWPFIISALE